MTSNPTEQDLLLEIHELVTAHLQHQMSVAQRDRLQELVCNDPQARRLYVSYIFDSFDLHSRTAQGVPSASENFADDHAPFLRRASRLTRTHSRAAKAPMSHSGWLKACVEFASRPLSLLLMVLVLGALAAWRLTNVADESLAARVAPVAQEGARAPVEAQPAARVVRAVAAIWDEGHSPANTTSANGAPAQRVTAKDRLVVGQSLSLRRGTAEIAFDSGARVFVEGPAVFEIESVNGGRLTVGKLMATVPPAATGFVIDTPSTKVIDLGTEFAVAVDRVGGADVHVFLGNVTAQQASASPRAGAAAFATPPLELRAGQSAQFTPLSALPASGPALPPPAITVGRADEQRFAQLIGARRDADAQAATPVAASPVDAEALGRWQQYSAALAKDPDVILYYHFQDIKPTDKSVANQAVSGLQPRAEILGAEATTGRWAGKGAMQFDGRNGRLHVVVPGEYRVLSVMAWVYLNHPSPYGMSLLCGDGMMRYGMLKWDLTGQEAINLATNYPKHGTVNYVTPPGVVKIAGRWAHLVAVYDGNAGQVSQYLDGQPLGAAKIVSDLPLAPGAITVGGWQESEGRLLGQFEGRIDELAILKRALSQEEIHKGFLEFGTKQP